MSTVESTAVATEEQQILNQQPPPPPAAEAEAKGGSTSGSPSPLEQQAGSRPQQPNGTTASTSQQLQRMKEEMTAQPPSTPSAHDPANHHTNVPGVAGNGQQYSVEYLSQLLKDKKQLAAFPNVFHHLERLADEEISKVRVALFQFEFAKGEMQLPEPEGDVQVTTEKVFVPAKEHPDYNFVGRILGPRGMTAKQLEQETGCKIMVRGRGSMRDKKKEEMNRGKPNWEHLNDELHVLIQVEDTPNRSRVKLARAVDEVKKLLVPAPEGEDELKRKQLMELAIINGTYRSASQQNAAVAAQLAAAKQNGMGVAAALQAAALAQQQQRGLIPIQLAGQNAQIRSPTLAGAPIIMSPSTRGSTANQATSQASAAAAQMLALNQQQHAAFSAAQQQAPQAASPASLMAAQQAALIQQQAAAAGLSAVDYQQLLYNQQAAAASSMGYDAQTIQALQLQQQQAVALQQHQQQQAASMANVAAYGGMLGQYVSAEAYSQDLSGSAGGAIMQQRRVLGSSREHPYKQ